MEEHPVENRELRMSGAVDSWHGRSHESRNGPVSSRKG
jgi:hypothetical protein